jgi:hypothetical protein
MLSFWGAKIGDSVLIKAISQNNQAFLMVMNACGR